MLTVARCDAKASREAYVHIDLPTALQTPRLDELVERCRELGCDLEITSTALRIDTPEGRSLVNVPGEHEIRWCSARLDVNDAIEEALVQLAGGLERCHGAADGECGYCADFEHARRIDEEIDATLYAEAVR